MNEPWFAKPWEATMIGASMKWQARQAIRGLLALIPAVAASAALVLGAPAPAMAGTLGTPSVTPGSLTAGTPATVTVNISITDPNFTLGGANLLRLKPDGSTATILGVLHDDGVQGDPVAGDKVYTFS